MMRSAKFRYLLLRGLLLLPALLAAQTTGKIAGKVKDASTGQALPGAVIVLEGIYLGSDQIICLIFNKVSPKKRLKQGLECIF